MLPTFNARGDLLLQEYLSVYMQRISVGECVAATHEHQAAQVKLQAGRSGTALCVSCPEWAGHMGPKVTARPHGPCCCGVSPSVLDRLASCADTLRWLWQVTWSLRTARRTRGMWCASGCWACRETR